MRPKFESPVVTGLAASLIFGIGLLSVPTSGSADSLHIFCWGATSCASNATPNLQTNTNPPQFGVTDTGHGVTPGSSTTSSTTTKHGVTTTTTVTTTITDDLIVDILDPTKTPSKFSPSALSPFKVTLFSGGVSTGITVDSTNPTQTTAFIGPGGAKLSKYLAGAGTDHFNSNPFSSITLLAPNTGFWVYQVDLGQQTLGNNQDFELLSSALDQDSVILAFLTATTTVETCKTGTPCTTKTSFGYTSTANSEMLFENGPPPTIHNGGETPLPAALPLFAGGLGVMGMLGWRRKRAHSAAHAATQSK
jgi:hypothetical protein